jgi:hypothetical protein
MRPYWCSETGSSFSTRFLGRGFLSFLLFMYRTRSPLMTQYCLYSHQKVDCMCKMMNQNKSRSSINAYQAITVIRYETMIPTSIHRKLTGMTVVLKALLIGSASGIVKPRTVFYAQKRARMWSGLSLALGISNRIEELTSLEQFTRKTQENLDGYRVMKKTHSIKKLDKHTNT